MMRDNELAGLALTLGRDTRMKITLGGDTSYCSPDGSHINIARMPATPLGRLLMTGLVFHEVAHKHYTKGTRPPGLLGELTNIIEDIRVEALLIKERPGTSYDLEAVTRYYADKGSLTPRDLPQALLGLVMAHGRREILGQPAIGSLREPCRKMLAASLGEPWVREIEQLLATSFPSLASTDDARRLAEALIAKLRQLPEPEPPPTPAGQAQSGQDDDQDEDQDAEGDGGTAPSGDGPDQQDDDQLQDNGATEMGGGQEKEDDAGDAGSSEDNAPSQKAGKDTPRLNPLTEKQIEQAILNGTCGFGDLSKMLTRDLTALAAETPPQLRNAIPLLPKVGRRRASADQLDETDALSACSRMRARLLTLLQAQTLKPRHYGSSGRKLVSKRLVRMALGDARIFSRRVETQALSTAVVILLDTSGSMMDEGAGGRKRYEVANPAAFALHVALKGLPGVVVASAEFSQRLEHQPAVNVLVDFAEAPKSQAFNLRPDGGTPTHEALWYARAALLQRPEARRIILLVTDGYPVDGEQTRVATKRCAKDGIEIAALGIETDAVQRYWRNFEVINDVRELPRAMFAVMENLLLSKQKSSPGQP